MVVFHVAKVNMGYLGDPKGSIRYHQNLRGVNEDVLVDKEEHERKVDPKIQRDHLSLDPDLVSHDMLVVNLEYFLDHSHLEYKTK